MCNANAIAWCTKKSAGPIVKNSEFLPLLMASVQPGNHTWLLAIVAGLSLDDNNTLKPYNNLPAIVQHLTKIYPLCKTI